MFLLDLHGNMTKLIQINVYNSDVLVHFGTEESLIKYMKNNGFTSYVDEVKDILSQDKAVILAETFMLDTGQTIMWFSEKKPNIGLIAHEVFHAVYNLLERIGIRLSSDSEEAYAYLTQFLINEITNN